MGTTTGTGTSTIRSFKISIPEAQLSSLHQKLALASFPDEVDHDDSTRLGSMGAPLDDIKRLTNHWKHSFDWRKAERELNEMLPQFVASVPVAGFGEMDVHFVYQKGETKGKNRAAIPLLFLHGCKDFIFTLLSYISPAANDPQGPGASSKSRKYYLF
jgi:microsomal epoxide hydrolase